MSKKFSEEFILSLSSLPTLGVLKPSLNTESLQHIHVALKKNQHIFHQFYALLSFPSTLSSLVHYTLL